ncbi:MAG: D-alanyl-D-alanine carboxypeptidase [Nitrospinae bacterium]|nr:D-alanyl-D-alanine carboxypeptidase [Nitrospinota bacterium]
MRHRWKSLVLSVAMLSTAPVSAPPVPNVDADAWLVASSDKILWAHNADSPLPSASLTKIMTVMLALRRTPPETIVAVSARAASESGAKTGLSAGDRVRAGLLAAAALMESANDACMALAESAAETPEAFVAMMNDEARRMGLRHTRFQNPCGHDARNHYSSANDVLAVARAAMKNPFFASIVSMRTGSFSTVDGKRKFSFQNKNELIGRYPGAEGVKTGTTPAAGKCLVALVRRDGLEVWLVMLNARERWWTSARILDSALRALGAPLDF